MWQMVSLCLEMETCSFGSSGKIIVARYIRKMQRWGSLNVMFQDWFKICFNTFYHWPHFLVRLNWEYHGCAYIKECI